MQNIPEVKLGIVAVSRDCFPITLSEKRRKAVVAAFKAKGYDIYERTSRRPASTRWSSSWATSAPKALKRSSPRSLAAR